MTQIGQGPCDRALLAQARRDDAGCGRATGRWVLAATILASSMSFIDGTVVNVALPTLQRSLGATVAELQWVVEAYALSLSACLLLGGVLGDRYGRNRVMALGVALFALASIGCGAAADAGQLIAARGVQGLGAALMVPNSLAIISANFGEGERGRAIGTWSAFSALATAAGPVLGGWLIDAVSWRWIFFINLPPAMLVLWMLWRRVPETPRSQPLRAHRLARGTACQPRPGGHCVRPHRGRPSRVRRSIGHLAGIGGSSRIGRLFSGRAPRAAPDDAAWPVPVADILRRQPDHAISLWCTGRNVFPAALQSDSDPGLEHGRDRTCAAALRYHFGVAVPLGGRAGRSFWRPARRSSWGLR